MQEQNMQTATELIESYQQTKAIMYKLKKYEGSVTILSTDMDYKKTYLDISSCKELQGIIIEYLEKELTNIKEAIDKL
jgi:hypothetical protein